MFHIKSDSNWINIVCNITVYGTVQPFANKRMGKTICMDLFWMSFVLNLTLTKYASSFVLSACGFDSTSLWAPDCLPVKLELDSTVHEHRESPNSITILNLQSAETLAVVLGLLDHGLAQEAPAKHLNITQQIMIKQIQVFFRNLLFIRAANMHRHSL